MIKKISLFLAAAVFVFSGCSLVNDLKSLEKPETVTVRFDGQKYEVPLGNVNMKMNKYLNVAELKDKMDNSDINIYDYNALGCDDVQEYLIDYPMINVPLDFSEYLDKLEIGQRYEKSFNNKIKIPGTINNQDVSVSLPDIKMILVAGFRDITLAESDRNFKVTEVGSNGGLNSNILNWDECTINFGINITGATFDSMSFKTGKLYVVVAPKSGSPVPSDNFLLKVKPTLKDSKGNIISQGELTDVHLGGSIALDITGKTLPSSGLKISFEGDIAQGYEGQEDKYEVKVILDKINSTLSGVTGLVLPQSDLIPAISFSNSISLDDLKEFLITTKIYEGKLAYSAELPSAWNGIVCDLTLTMTGSLACTQADFADVTAKDGKNYLFNKCLDFKGKNKTLDLQYDQEISIDGKIELSFDKANLVFKDSDPTEMPIKGGISITKLSETKMNGRKFIDSSSFIDDFWIGLSDSIVGYMDYIKFSKIGLDITIVNYDLPKNDMLMSGKLWSNAFKITEASPLSDDYVVDNASDSLNIVKEWEEGNEVTIKPSEAEVHDGEHSLDLRTNFVIDNKAKTGTGIITFSEVIETEKEYNFEAKVVFEYDWTELSIKTDAAIPPFEGSFDASINLKDMLKGFFAEGHETEAEDIISKVNFKDIKGFMVVSRPADGELEIFPEDFGFAGKVDIAFYDEGEATPKQEEPLLVESSDPYLMKTNGINLADYADEDFVINDKNNPLFPVYTDHPEDLFYSAELSSSALIDILNLDYKTCKLNYSMAFSGGSSNIVFKKSDIEKLVSGEGSCSINFSIILRLPLVIEITDKIEITDVLDLAGNKQEEDILNRDSPDEDSDLTKYSEIIREIGFNYSISSNTGLTMKATLYDVNSLITPKEIQIDKIVSVPGKNKHSVNISTNEINNILDGSRASDWELKPAVGLEIDAGEIKVGRNAFFNFCADMYVVTKGDYVLVGDDDE